MEYPHRLSVAPMMQVTDRHWRFMARGLSAETLLYTEMMVDTAVVHNPSKFVGFDPCEAPIALQMGGNDPELLAQATQLVTRHLGAACVEVNLNCGCPSHVVAGKQCFGARLMADPVRVGTCVAAMQGATSVPVTVKHRLGTDLSGADYDTTSRFVRTVAEFGVRHFALHARMAILGVRMSTEKNRTVPPLKPEVAHMLARDMPDLTFSLNGGLKTLDDCVTHLTPGDLPPVHSTMVGRAAWHAPCDLLASADMQVYGKATTPASNRRALVERYADYLDDFYVRSATDDDISAFFRPLHYIFAGARGAKRFRTLLVEKAPHLVRRHKEDVAPSDVIWDSIQDVATLPLDEALVVKPCPL